MGIWRDSPLTVHCLGWCHITWSLWYPISLLLGRLLPLGPECELLLFFGGLHPYISRVTSLHFYPTFAPPKKKVHFLELNGSAMADDFWWLTWWSLRLNSVVPAMARWFFFCGASVWMWWFWLVYFCLGDGQVIFFGDYFMSHEILGSRKMKQSRWLMECHWWVLLTLLTTGFYCLTIRGLTRRALVNQVIQRSEQWQIPWLFSAIYRCI